MPIVLKMEFKRENAGAERERQFMADDVTETGSKDSTAISCATFKGTMSMQFKDSDATQYKLLHNRQNVTLLTSIHTTASVIKSQDNSVYAFVTSFLGRVV
jgi:hypothetical protein